MNAEKDKLSDIKYKKLQADYEKTKCETEKIKVEIYEKKRYISKIIFLKAIGFGIIVLPILWFYWEKIIIPFMTNEKFKYEFDVIHLTYEKFNLEIQKTELLYKYNDLHLIYNNLLKKNKIDKDKYKQLEKELNELKYQVNVRPEDNYLLRFKAIEKREEALKQLIEKKYLEQIKKNKRELFKYKDYKDNIDEKSSKKG